MEQQPVMDCVFCSIAEKKIPSNIIYEDEICVAFLDIRPSTLGHTLLIPKKHFQVMQQIEEDTIKHLFLIAKKISHSFLRVLRVKGVNIFIANGASAGQRAPHFIMHIIPRNESNKGIFQFNQNNLSEKELRQLQIILKKKLSFMFGKEEKKVIEEKKEKKELGDLVQDNDEKVNLDIIGNLFK